MQKFVSDAPVSKNLRAGLWSLLAFIVIFGAIVEFRSAFLTQRRTDADDFFRAGWGIRTGLDIYSLTDTHGWHYNYPPFFAILISPLANPPPGAPRDWMLPYEVSVALWYLASVAAVALGVHWLASALEEHLGGALATKPPPFCSRWWMLRLIPTLVCLPSIGRTLSRGQVNTLVLFFFCGVCVMAAKKRSMLSGMFIAAAAAIKIIPAYIGLNALLRRDWRCVAGCFLGTVLCLGVVPLVVLGPTRTVECYHKYYDVMIGPALTGGGDQSRAVELLAIDGTDSQSFMVMIHNTMHPRQPRPPVAARWVKPVHWALSALITLVALWYGRKARPDDALYNVMFLGVLIVTMLPISPASHTHYLMFALPLVMALTAYSWEKNQAPVLSKGYFILFVVHVAANVIAMPQSLMVLKALGLPMYGTMILWVAGLRALKERSEMPLPAPVSI